MRRKEEGLEKRHAEGNRLRLGGRTVSEVLSQSSRGSGHTRTVRGVEGELCQQISLRDRLRADLPLGRNPVQDLRDHDDSVLAKMGRQVRHRTVDTAEGERDPARLLRGQRASLLGDLADDLVNVHALSSLSQPLSRFIFSICWSTHFCISAILSSDDSARNSGT